MTPTETAKAGPAPLPRACAKPASVAPKGTRPQQGVCIVPSNRTTVIDDTASLKTMSTAFMWRAAATLALSAGSVWGLGELWMAVAL